MTFFKVMYRCYACQFEAVPCAMCLRMAEETQRHKNKSEQLRIIVNRCSNCGNWFNYLRGTINYKCINCAHINTLRNPVDTTPNQNEQDEQHTFGSNNKQVLTELIDTQEKEIEQLTKAIEKLKSSVTTLKLARDILK